MDRAEAIAAINAGTADDMSRGSDAGSRRLALCFEGTWNSLDSQTNVSRLFRSIATISTGCPGQLSFYDSGVGTRPLERLRGGAFGLGLDGNVLDGYCWLVNNYRRGTPAPDDGDPSGELFDRGDMIYLFGFSRGAFTARTLAGLLNRVGIVDRTRIADGHATPDTPEIKEAWQLYRLDNPDQHAPGRDMEVCRAFRVAKAITVKIKMVGVWDTVGALGIPKLRAPLPWPSGGRYRFHDTTLGRVIENAYHAMAIDEQRYDYRVTLWTRPKTRLWAQDVEQRWFPGAHANVGGGYPGDLLNEPPLLWLAQKAAATGLNFSTRGGCAATAPAEFQLDGSEYLSPVRDSYAAFMGGLYRVLGPVFGGHGRYLRPMMVERDGMNQTIDPTAWLKWDADVRYRPANLARAGRSDGSGEPAGDRP